jgi:porphyrinogen peroxidase
MSTFQPAIVRPVPTSARFLTFALRDDATPGLALECLAVVPHDPDVVVGVAATLAPGVEGHRAFPDDLRLAPSTQAALWVFVAHADRSAQFDAARRLAGALGDAFAVVEEIDAFTYRGGRDLSDFEDGTENPKGDAALAAAVISGRGAGLDGGSFVAVQRWVHDLAAVEAMPEHARESVVGRRQRTNEEIPDAPESAHVKRTAQESFEPPAFILRRSMPYGGVAEHGLYFVAYGESFDRFERQLRRMAGREDGVVDALFSFSRAVTGGYYYCPPVVDGRLDLRALRGR